MRERDEMYGIKVNRNGMAVCPFHNDKNPSMKVDKRFHCFACQADGDVIDFVSRLCGLPCKEAAMKLADDFGISYDSRHKPTDICLRLPYEVMVRLALVRTTVGVASRLVQ